MLVVIKRDGRKVDFNRNKIENAILKAMEQVGNRNFELAHKIANSVERISKSNISVEEIQDIVESKLMDSNCKDVAKAYIIYRNDRTREREKNNEIIQQVWKRLNATEIQNANANVDENSFSGREKEASSDLQKAIARKYIMSEDVAEECDNGLIYHHDLEKFAIGEHNCLNIDFSYLFSNGFRTRNGDVRPPTSFSTACQLVAVIFQCQSQVQFGGTGTVHQDIDLAPYVKMSFIKHLKDGLKYIEKMSDYKVKRFFKYYKDVSLANKSLQVEHSDVYQYAIDMLEKEGKQATQALFHNLNTLESRQGSQVPFTSSNFGRDTSPEGRLVTKWMLEASLDGIGKYHLTSIFPISIFQYKDGINAKKGDPNYDLKQLALKSMSKRIYPNWCNCNWSQAHEDENNPDTFFSTMGCRTMLGYDRHGLGYTRVGRGNNVPVTIILPKLGIEYGICLKKRIKPDLVGFWEAFERTLKLTEKALLERFAIMCQQSPKSAPFMYQNNTIKDANKCTENVYNALKHNTLAIGYIGIAEMCVALFGENHIHNQEVHKFAISVVKRINEFASEASERNDLNFSCYATPAEGLCRTALNNLRNQYGIIENVTSRDFITNSHHVPVWEKVSIYDKLRIEAPFCKYPTGGVITYVELDSTFVKNTKAVEDIIDYAFKKLDIPYLAFNFPIDSCLDCGYQDEFNNYCPECNSNHIQQLRRVTGYLSTDYHNFNDGKKAEVQERIKHSQYTDLGG